MRWLFTAVVVLSTIGALRWVLDPDPNDLFWRVWVGGAIVLYALNNITDTWTGDAREH